MPAWDHLAAAVLALLSMFALYRLGFRRRWALALPLGVTAIYSATRWGGLGVDQSAAVCVFLFAYAVIVSDKVHKTVVALAGAATVLVLRIVDQHTALHGSVGVEGTDWNTIFLLVGMMVVVNITRRTGVFEWIAIKAVKLAKGHPLWIMVALCTATALISAALDNVTTVLLIAPVTLAICMSLRLDPVPYLITVVIASNVGGTATLIGDPPNIMIGSAARIDFMEFMRVDAPVVLVIYAVNIATVMWWFRRRLTVPDELRATVMQFDERAAITDPKLLKRCLAVIGLVLLGFGVHGAAGLEPATIAMCGAAALLLIRREEPDAALREVEWPTILFFVGLFVMVSALVKTGIVRMMGLGIIDVACGRVGPGGLDPGQRTLLTLGVCWFSGFASGIVDNIPFVATMNAVIHDMAVSLHPSPTTADFFQIAHAKDIYPLWWALSLGACLGGNFTLIGASANVVVAGIADRAKHPISFVRFLKYGIPLTLQGLIISSVYLWLRFLR